MTELQGSSCLPCTRTNPSISTNAQGDLTACADSNAPAGVRYAPGMIYQGKWYVSSNVDNIVYACDFLANGDLSCTDTGAAPLDNVNGAAILNGWVRGALDPARWVVCLDQTKDRLIARCLLIDW